MAYRPPASDERQMTAGFSRRAAAWVTHDEGV
jgi:hypothetical protein